MSLVPATPIHVLFAPAGLFGLFGSAAHVPHKTVYSMELAAIALGE